MSKRWRQLGQTRKRCKSIIFAHSSAHTAKNGSIVSVVDNMCTNMCNLNRFQISSVNASRSSKPILVNRFRRTSLEPVSVWTPRLILQHAACRPCMAVTWSIQLNAYFLKHLALWFGHCFATCCHWTVLNWSGTSQSDGILGIMKLHICMVPFLRKSFIIQRLQDNDWTSCFNVSIRGERLKSLETLLESGQPHLQWLLLLWQLTSLEVGHISPLLLQFPPCTTSSLQVSTTRRSDLIFP